MRKAFLGLAIAGSFVLVASQASAWSGELVKCLPSPGTQLDVVFKKGLTCQDTLNKIQIRARHKDGNAIDNCQSNAAAPWDTWVAGKYLKTPSADAANIGSAEIQLKGITFGSCNFGGSPTSAGASGGGKITFLNAAGTSKIKGAALSFFGNVAGEAATVSATARGLVTKGMGTGGRVAVTIGLDILAPENELTVACQTGPFPFGQICTTPGVSVYEAGDDVFIPGPGGKKNEPAIYPPIGVLKIITGATSSLVVQLGEPDPNDPNDPFSFIP